MKLAITGASGQLGRLTADALLERIAPSDVVLISRQPANLAGYAERGVELRAGDFADPAALADALAGVDRLLIISTDAVGSRLEPQIAAVKAAAQAGVSRILYTSITRPEPGNPAAVVADHAGTEQALRDSGTRWTILRNAIYADMQRPTIEQAATTGQLVTNVGAGRYAYVTRADCAEAAAAALVSDEADDTIFDITGPQAVSSADLAALGTQVGGREVAVVDVDDAAYVAGLVEHAGLPRPVAELLASFHIAARLGYFETVTDDFTRLTGRAATSLAALLA